MMYQLLFLICGIFIESLKADWHTPVQNSNIALTISPSYIVPKVNYDVDIECRFRRHQVTSLAAINTLAISYSDKADQPDFNFVASVSVMDGHAHNISHNIWKMTAAIDNDGESFLHLTFKNSETNLTGLYQCEVIGLDDIGRPVTNYNTLKVQETSMQSVLSRLDNCIPILDTTQTCNESSFYSSQLYLGHRYCLHKTDVHSHQASFELDCQAMGGYLVEIDTHGEYLFVKDFIGHHGLFKYVYTGVTDEAHEGFWVNKHNSTLRPFSQWEWGPGEPNKGNAENCMCFYQLFNWSLVDFECSTTDSSIAISYICELTQ